MLESASRMTLCNFLSSGLTTDHLLLSRSDSGWPRRESNPDLAFRKRLFYPLNYSANTILFFVLYALCFPELLLWSIPITMSHQVVSFQPVWENLHMLIF